ncbi:DUF4862 family protein [Microbulbifer agarilyticus]
MKYILGAYATAPVTDSWQPEVQEQYLNRIKQLDNVRGLEHPFTGSLHGHDDDWFLRNIDPQWNYVFTGVPGVMGSLAKNPAFGIASDDEDGRAAGIEFYRKMHAAVLKLNGHLGRKAVDYVQLHTSPNRTKSNSSTDSLKRSLQEIVSWDWDGAGLVIEHCDAFVDGSEPEKGFLTLQEEIATIQAVNAASGSKLGISINWGRSALETRSVEGPLEHLRLAREAGLLRGLMFSGISDLETPYGVWRDTHMPPAEIFAEGYFAEGSLLTREQMALTLETAGWQDLDFVGAKLGVRPRDLDVDSRVAYNRDCLNAIDLLTKDS